MQENERYMTVTDENGNKKEMYILFTTTLEEYEGKEYVFFTDPQDEEKQVFAAYIENDALTAISDENEWNLLAEVFEDFMKNAQKNHGCGGCGGCGSNCEGDCDGNCDCDGSCDGDCSCHNK